MQRGDRPKYLVSWHAKMAKSSPVISKLWARAFENRLYSNAFFIFVNTVASSGMGFLFWALASRLYPTAILGSSSSILSLAHVLASVGGLGLSVGLSRFLPDADEPVELANFAILFSAVLSLAVGVVVFLPVSRLPWSSLPELSLGVGMTTLSLSLSISLFTTTGAVFIATRTSKYLFFQVLIMNIARLGLVGAMSRWPDWGIPVSILGGYLLASVICWLLFARIVLPGYQIMAISVNLKRLKEIISFSFGDFLGDLLRQAPQNLTVPLALALAGSEESAYLYVAWMIVALVQTPSIALGRSLLVESAHFPAESRRLLLKAGMVTMGITIPLALVTAMASKELLSLFGADYAIQGAAVLRLMLIASPLFAGNMLLMAFFRIRKSVGMLVVGSLILALISLATSASTIGLVGLQGIGYAWIAANSLTLLYLAGAAWRVIPAQATSPGMTA